MSYLKTIEFLVKEVAKANEQIESLTRKAEVKSDELKKKDSVMDRLEDSLTRMSEELGLTKKRYEALLETNRKKDKMNDNKVQELQLEINHLKRNK